MHAVFMLYGKYECVEALLRDMRAQKLPLKFWKEGEPDKFIYVECQIRVMPFGFYEFIFPKEYQDAVLTTMGFHLKDQLHPDGNTYFPYRLDKEISILGMKFSPLEYLKKFLKIEDAPEFKAVNKLVWMDQHIAIVPIGVRYDDIIEEVWGPNAGWKHEAI